MDTGKGYCERGPDGREPAPRYCVASRDVHHTFCKHCGVRSFEWGDIPELGGKYYTVNVACLEGVDIDELVSAPTRYADGRNNNWQSAPAEVRHL